MPITTPARELKSDAREHYRRAGYTREKKKTFRCTLTLTQDLKSKGPPKKSAGAEEAKGPPCTPHWHREMLSANLGGHARPSPNPLLDVSRLEAEEPRAGGRAHPNANPNPNPQARGFVRRRRSPSPHSPTRSSTVWRRRSLDPTARSLTTTAGPRERRVRVAPCAVGSAPEARRGRVGALSSRLTVIVIIRALPAGGTTARRKAWRRLCAISWRRSAARRRVLHRWLRR